jgi:hypothetical protein
MCEKIELLFAHSSMMRPTTGWSTAIDAHPQDRITALGGLGPDVNRHKT